MINALSEFSRVSIPPSYNLFAPLKQSLAAQKYKDAINELLFLFNTKADPQECYNYLFELFSYLDSLDLLIQNLPFLLNRSAQLVDCQHQLATQMADWYTTKGELENAMHCYAKALQIREIPEVHLQASQLFIHFLKSRLSTLLPNSMPSPATLTAYLARIASLKKLGATKEDLRPFYALVKQRLTNISNQEPYAACRETILQYERQPEEHLPPITMRYLKAFRSYRDQFRQECPEIRAFQGHIFQTFKAFFNTLVQDALFILGPPPCGYDIRAMGSTGREELCPYSDLEFMILVEHQDPYFKELVDILHLQIALLGETPRFEFVFTCIHKKNPSGLHIDNSPKQEQRLIQSPVEMAALQKEFVTHPQDIAHTVLKTISLAQNTPHLFISYQEHLKELLPREKRASTFLQTRLRDFKERWKTFTTIHHIKEQYVELLNLFLSDLALKHGVSATNTLDIIDALPDFTPASRLLLKECVATLYKIRLRLHLTYQEQKEEAAIGSHPHFISLEEWEISALLKCYWLVLCPLYSQTPYHDLASCAQSRGYFANYRLKLFHHKCKNILVNYKTTIKMTGPVSGYLNPAFDIVDAKDNIKSQYANSVHNVCSSGKFHFKQKPSHPLMEYALFSLTSRIAGTLTPVSTLVRFDVGTKSYPVLISETISGSQYTNQKPELKQWTHMLLAAILTRPGDGRASNYVIHNGMLYCVDNDISFVEPVINGSWGYRTVQFCSALFLMYPLSTPLDTEVLSAFQVLDRELILDGWIEDVIEKEKEYMALFSPEEQKKLYSEDPNNAFIPTILFREGTLTTLDLQFWKLQNLISRTPHLTAGDLLKELISIREDNIGTFVYKAYDQGKDLKQATSRTQESSLTSIQYHKACLGRIPTHDEIVQKKSYTPQKAREELFHTLIARCGTQAEITNRPGKNTIRANFEHLDANRQALVLKALIQSCEQKPHVVVLNHCTILTPDLLAPFLHSKLECLDLSYCTGINDGVFNTLQVCTSLKELNLTGTNITQIYGGWWNPLVDFPCLESLTLDRCIQLQAIQVRAPQLKIFQANHNPLLKEITLKAGVLAQITHKNSPQVTCKHIAFEEIRTLKGHTSFIFNLIELADGTIASSSYDKTVKLWNPKTGTCLHTLNGQDRSIYELVNILVTESQDGTVELWDLKKYPKHEFKPYLGILDGPTKSVLALTSEVAGELVEVPSKVIVDNAPANAPSDKISEMWNELWYLKTGFYLGTREGKNSLRAYATLTGCMLVT